MEERSASLHTTYYCQHLETSSMCALERFAGHVLVSFHGLLGEQLSTSTFGVRTLLHDRFQTVSGCPGHSGQNSLPISNPRLTGAMAMVASSLLEPCRRLAGIKIFSEAEQ